MCVLRRSEDVFFPFTAFSVSTYFAFSLLPLPFLFPPFVSRGFRAGFGVNQLQIYGEKKAIPWPYGESLTQVGVVCADRVGVGGVAGKRMSFCT